MTLSLIGGASVEEAQAMARHADISTTMVYALGSPIQGILSIFICLMPHEKGSTQFIQRGIIVFVVYFSSRLLTRYALFLTDVFSHNTTLVFVMVGIALMALVVVTFIQAMRMLGGMKQEMKQIDAEKLNELLEREKVESLSEMRKSTIYYNATELGRQYLLSDREIEVISLYALGYTQKRIANELQVSQNTVHSHIQGVYAKTGLHSRQAILDYMQKHTS